MQNWLTFTWAWDGAKPTSFYVLGNGQAPGKLGSGAFWMFTGSGDPVESFVDAMLPITSAHKLGDLNRFRYSYFANSGAPAGGTVAPYGVIDLDTNGDGNRDDGLLFLINDNGPLVLDRWKTTDTTIGLWRRSNDMTEAKTLSQWAASGRFKSARILDVAVSLGGGGIQNKIGGVDAIEIGWSGSRYVVYNFETK